MELFDLYKNEVNRRKEEEYSLEEYLDLCKEDALTFATAQERLIAAIGEPEYLDTTTDPVLARKHQNRTIKVYPMAAIRRS